MARPIFYMDLKFAVLLVVVHNYIAQVQAICIAEFNTGRRVLLAELRLRIQTYYMPPVKTLAVGHFDQRKVRAGLIISLSLFLQRVGPGHAPDQLLFVEHLEEVLGVIHGAAFEDYPTARRFAWRPR